MNQIIEMIKIDKLTEAIDAVKAMQTGLDWNYSEDDDEEPTSADLWPEAQHSDGRFFSVLNDLFAARLLTGGERDHFKKIAVLRLQAMAGSGSAERRLEQAITAGALTAEARLRQIESGN